jgi:hypothetical protein
MLFVLLRSCLFSLLAARVSGAVLPRWLVSLFAVRCRLRPRCSPCRSGVQSRFPRRIVASAWFGLATLFFESCVSCSCPDPVQACAKCVPISAAAPASRSRACRAQIFICRRSGGGSVRQVSGLSLPLLVFFFDSAAACFPAGLRAWVSSLPVPASSFLLWPPFSVSRFCSRRCFTPGFVPAAQASCSIDLGSVSCLSFRIFDFGVQLSPGEKVEPEKLFAASPEKLLN